MPRRRASLCPSNVKFTSSTPYRSAASPKAASAPFAAPLNNTHSSVFIASSVSSLSLHPVPVPTHLAADDKMKGMSGAPNETLQAALKQLIQNQAALVAQHTAFVSEMAESRRQF